MFKSLLRTLPSLTGNVTLACKITDVETQENNIYNGYCREAELKPLQNNLYNKYVSVNLLSGSYEYDVAKFYKQYNDVFYKQNFEFNTNDFKLYQEYTENYDRNVNYEFGCKRISYNVHQYMFEFFAPIFIDDINDIPDYFDIDIQINDYLTKKLRINIGQQHYKNFLYTYLSKYIAKLDKYMIFYNDDLKSFIYYAIDVDHGGFVKIQDNTIKNIISNQTTINLFDKSINKGFENNKLIMKQIIPISFLFNINDILNSTEKRIYKFIRIQKISGHYQKNNVTTVLYDFNINYDNIPLAINNTDSLNMYYNMMSPYSFPENHLDIYKYENKLLPLYNKWKLQLSKDETYYTNLNINYSINHKYSNQYDTIIDYNNDLYVDNGNVDIENKEYHNFEVISYNTLNDSKLFFENNNWNECINNYAYVNYFLYNLNVLVNKFSLPKIDYFNIFITLPSKSQSESLIFTENNYHETILVNNIFDFNIDHTNRQLNIQSFNESALIDKEQNLISLHPNLNKNQISSSISNDIFFNKSSKFDQSKKQYIHINRYEKYIKSDDVEAKLNKIIQDYGISSVIIGASSQIDLDKCDSIYGYVQIPNINYIQNIEIIYKSIFDKLFFKNDYVNEITQCKLKYNTDLEDITDINILNLIPTKFYIRYKFFDYSLLYQFFKEILNMNYDYFNDLFKDTIKYEYNIKDNTFKKHNTIHKKIYIDNIKQTNKIGLIKIDNKKLFDLYYGVYGNENWYQSKPVINNYSSYEVIDENLISIINVKNTDNNLLTYNNDDYVLHKQIYLSPITKEQIKSILINKETYYMYVKDDVDFDFGKLKYININDETGEYLSDTLLLHKIFNDSNRTLEEINYQKQLILYENICFYDSDTEEYIKITLDNIDDSKYTDNDIVFIENVSYKYSNMIEANEHILNIILNDKISPLIKNQTSIIRFNELIKILSNNSIILDNIASSKYFISTQINDITKYVININELTSYIKSLVDQLNSLNIFNLLNYNNVSKFLFNEKDVNYINIKTYITYHEDTIISYLNDIQNQLYANLFEHINIDLINNELLNTDITNNSKDILSILYENYPTLYANILEYFNIQLYEYFNNNNTNALLTKDLTKQQNAIMSHNMNINKQNKDDNGEDLPILFFEYNDKIYACLLLQQLFSNTNLTYNLVDAQVFDYVDNIPVSQALFNTYYIKKLMPYCKQNIFNNTIKILSEYGMQNLIIYPKQYPINIKYTYSLKFNENLNGNYLDSLIYSNDSIGQFIKDNDSNVYQLEELNKPTVMYLYRYLNYIAPIFTPILHNTISTYKCKYKYVESIIFDSDNIYNDLTDITSYNGIKCFYNNTASKIINNKFNIIKNVEYKHFNDNSYYNLEPNFEINIDKELTYEQLLEYETTDIILDYFTKYIKRYIKNNSLDENQILFLFNKYKVSCHSIPIVLDFLKTHKLYSLKYIFNLL